MPRIFNHYPSPSLFNLRHFRIAYALLPPIRNLITNSASHEALNIVSVACGTALEVASLELLARSRGTKVNYFGCDINRNDLRFNTRVLQQKSPSVKQTYISSNMANDPPISVISNAHGILWRHPEFLSDHEEMPKELILDMCQILWHVLDNKNEKAPLLITCYDPHEMMLVLEIVHQFCEDNLTYDLTIDRQHGRASWQNPTIDSEDLDPLFNLNHHDQCQLLITQCQLKKFVPNHETLLTVLAKAFHTLLPRIQTGSSNTLAPLLQHLKKPNLDLLREAVSYLNNQIREDTVPFMKREQLLMLLTAYYEQPKVCNSPPLKNLS